MRSNLKVNPWYNWLIAKGYAKRTADSIALRYGRLDWTTPDTQLCRCGNKRWFHPFASAYRCYVCEVGYPQEQKDFQKLSESQPTLFN